MHLCLFINPTGHHQAAWRRPDTQADAGVNFGHYRDLAQLAEQAKFDALFLADNQCVRGGPPEIIGRVAQYVANFEPLTLLGALAASTNRIGLIATASTSYNFPFQIARKFASLDHISGGRIGWNIVTSGMPEEAQNFGRDEHYEHDLRYEMAKEFVEICRGLWDSWEDDAFPRDKVSGVFSDISKLHELNHVGKDFRVKGPLNVPRSPQGYPVHVQAGTSPAGRSFAAQYAEMMFVSPLAMNRAQELYGGMKESAAAMGRNPDHLKVMPGLVPIVGRTEADAKAKQKALQDLLHPDLAIQFLSMKMGKIDLSGYPLDEPLPDNLPKPPTASEGFDRLLDKARNEHLTLRQLAISSAGSLAGMSIVGSVAEIVDTMEEWFRGGACDGFNIQPPCLPGDFTDFVELVVPELQRRGLARLNYEGSTLRDHFGLPRPESRYAGALAQRAG
jgi:FMN-dependent oxidoreductase (nitrilotriacetate monooxygenase family)